MKLRQLARLKPTSGQAAGGVRDTAVWERLRYANDPEGYARRQPVGIIVLELRSGRVCLLCWTRGLGSNTRHGLAVRFVVQPRRKSTGTKVPKYRYQYANRDVRQEELDRRCACRDLPCVCNSPRGYWIIHDCHYGRSAGQKQVMRVAIGTRRSNHQR